MSMPVDAVSYGLFYRIQQTLMNNTIFQPFWRYRARRRIENARQISSTTTAYADASTQTAREDGALPQGTRAEQATEDSTENESETETRPECIDEQATRSAKYLLYSGEDETDYTDGPARMVFGNDGVKDCNVMLMTLELSRAIQEAVLVQRHCNKAQAFVEAQDNELSKFCTTILDEIHNYEAKKLEAESSGDIEMFQDAMRTQYILNQMQEEIPNRKAVLQNLLRPKTEMLQAAHAKVAGYLEDVFVAAKLLDPDEAEDWQVEQFDLQEEFQTASAQFVQPEEHEEGPYYEPAPVSPALEPGTAFAANKAPSPTPSQQAITTIQATYYQAMRRYNAARTAFENKEAEIAQEESQRYLALTRGEPTIDATQEDFDLRCLKRKRELTQEFVQAEREVAEAKNAARQAGIEFDTGDEEAEYGDHCTEVSGEVDIEGLMAYLTPRIKDWSAGVPEYATEWCKDTADMDDWEAKEVDIGDSASCVDVMWYTEQIAQWQQICQEARRQTGETGYMREAKSLHLGASEVQDSTPKVVSRGASLMARSVHSAP